MGGAGDGEAHLAAGKVGDAAHRVDGLVGWPGTDQHMLARQHLGRKKLHQLVQQLVGFEHAAIADFAAGLLALAHVEHMDAVGLELGHVALGGGVGPHFAVHGRSHDQRHGIQRAGQAHQAEQVVGPAVQQLGHEVGTGRGHQDGIGIAGEVDVGHAVAHASAQIGTGGFARIPLRAEHGPPGQRLHGDGGDELHGRIGHDHLHAGPLFDQCAAQLGRLVAGNAARQTQNDVFSVKVFHARQCSSSGVAARLELVVRHSPPLVKTRMKIRFQSIA